jgi:hypothetical protein
MALSCSGCDAPRGTCTLKGSVSGDSSFSSTTLRSSRISSVLLQPTSSLQGEKLRPLLRAPLAPPAAAAAAARPCQLTPAAAPELACALPAPAAADAAAALVSVTWQL